MAHILVMDDEPAILTMMRTFFERDGHRVSDAHNGREGLHLLKQHTPDVVIADILMPEMDGLEFLLEKRKPGYTDISAVPVIAISGGVRGHNMDFLAQAKMFGASHVFSKPLNLHALYAAVQELLVVG